MDEKWNEAAVTRADTALKKALITNFEPLEAIEVWFTGRMGVDSLTLNSRMHYTDGGLEKLRYDLSKEERAVITDLKTMFEWAVGYLAAHLMKTIYRIEYLKAD